MTEDLHPIQQEQQYLLSLVALETLNLLLTVIVYDYLMDSVKLFTPGDWIIIRVLKEKVCLGMLAHINQKFKNK